MGDFRKLIVWQKAKDLTVEIYCFVNENVPLQRDYGFRDQLTRSVISISSNIAEGDELNSNKASVRHLKIAKGSCAEVKSLLIIGEEIGYFSNDQFKNFYEKVESISKMIYSLMIKRSNS